MFYYHFSTPSSLPAVLGFASLQEAEVDQERAAAVWVEVVFGQEGLSEEVEAGIDLGLQERHLVGQNSPVEVHTGDDLDQGRMRPVVGEGHNLDQIELEPDSSHHRLREDSSEEEMEIRRDLREALVLAALDLAGRSSGLQGH